MPDTERLVITPVRPQQFQGCSEGGWYLEGGNRQSAFVFGDKKTQSSSSSRSSKRKHKSKRDPSSEWHPVDVCFAFDALDSGLFEVLKSRLALQKTGRQALMQTARIIEGDHLQANQGLKEVAEAQGITLPAQTSPKFQLLLNSLQELNGPDFERAYIKTQLVAHQHAIDLFQKYLDSGKHKQLRTFAQQGLPILKLHLRLVQRLRKSSPV